MGVTPSKQPVTRSEVERLREAVQADKTSISKIKPTRQQILDKTYSDLRSYFQGITNYQNDVMIYQFQGLANLEEYLTTLNTEIETYQTVLNSENTDSLPYISETNKKDIKEMYDYLYLRVYLDDSTKASSIKGKIDKIIKDINQ